MGSGHNHDHNGGHSHSHGHSRGHDHDHHHGLGGHQHDLRGASKRSLTSALILIVGYMFAEVIGGILSGSLALIADAGHMLTDAASIGFALVALHFASKPASAERTFGYHRLEILAALANALTLWLIAGWVAFEAFHRFRDLQEVEGGLMLAIGSIGLVVNIIAAWILHRSAEHSVNVEGAFAHVMADLLGSVAVVVSGVLVWAFGWHVSDPILSVLIAVLILLSTWRLLGKVINVLLQGVPENVDVYKLCSEMEETPGVVVIHDVHVWNLAPGYDVLTAHVIIDPELSIAESEALNQQLRTIAGDKFGIEHITLQLETSPKGCTENHHVDHLHAREGTREIKPSLIQKIKNALGLDHHHHHHGHDHHHHHHHGDHDHEHGPNCGHTAVDHNGHTDYLHDGHLHHNHDGHYDDHVLDVTKRNPDACTAGHACSGHDKRHEHGPGCGHEAVPHGDHTDYLVDGHLHHPHGDHCDDHGKIK